MPQRKPRHIFYGRMKGGRLKPTRERVPLRHLHAAGFSVEGIEAHAETMKERRKSKQIRWMGGKLVVSEKYLRYRMARANPDRVEQVAENAVNDWLAGLEKKYGYGPLVPGGQAGLDERTLLVVLREMAVLEREGKEIHEQHQSVVKKAKKKRWPANWPRQIRTSSLDRLHAVRVEMDLLERFLGSRLQTETGGWRAALHRIYGVTLPAKEKGEANFYYNQVRLAHKKRKRK